MATHSSILAWSIPWTEELAGYNPWGGKESGTTEQLTLFQATRNHSLVPLLPSRCMFAWRLTPTPPDISISKGSNRLEIPSALDMTPLHRNEWSLSISATRNYGVFSLFITTPHLPRPVTWCNGKRSTLELNGLAPLLPISVTLGKLLDQSLSFLTYKVRIIHLCKFFCEN